MAWTNIANSNLDVGAPIRSVDILALRDNISAVPNGDTGAPRIKAEALNGGQSGNAPIYAARAWVNFNGTGTVAIRASGNVSSITDNGTGDYRVNFTTAMPDANYCVQGTGQRADFSNNDLNVAMYSIGNTYSNAMNTAWTRVAVVHASSAVLTDPLAACITVHR